MAAPRKETDAAAKYPNCNSVQTFAVVEEKELLAAPQTADATRADLIMVDQYSVRGAIDRAFPEQILIGLIRMGPTLVEQPAARGQCDMVLQAGYDGACFVGVEKAEPKAQKKFLKMIISLRTAWKGKLFMMDSPTLFMMEPSLPSRLHGILFCNPLTEENGEPKLKSGPQYEMVTRAIREAQLQCQQRSDFVALAMERISHPRDSIRPDVVPRFRKWASDQGLVPYVTYIGVHPLAPIPDEEGPISLLCDLYVAPFLAPEGTAGGVDVSAQREDSPFAAVSQIFADPATSSASQADRLRATITALEARPENFARSVAARLNTAAVVDVMSEEALLQPIKKLKEEKRAGAEEEVVADEDMDPHAAVRRKLDPNYDERKVKSEAEIDDEAALAGGQRELGVEPEAESYWAVLRVQERLREHGLLRNLLEKRLQEMYRPSGNVSQMTLDSRLEGARAMIKEHAMDTASLKRYGFNKEDIERLQNEMRGLCSAMEQHVTGDRTFKLEVYESDPVSLKQASFTLTEQCYLAVYQNTDSCLRIYIARNHPNWAEALTYCWLRAARYTHSTALLMETLVSARKERKVPVESKMLPDRVYAQLTMASYRQLAALLQTSAQGMQLPSQPAPTGLLADMVKQVQLVCEYRLTKEIDERKKKEAEDRATLAKEVPKDDLYLLMQRAMWLETDRKEFELLCHALIRLPGVSLNKTLRLLLLTQGRQTALTQLELTVRDANPFLVREPDLATIYIEFSGFTEHEAESIFGLSREQLGEILYNRIRSKMTAENTPGKHLTDMEAKHYERTSSRARSIGLYLSKYADGLFFLLPLLLNFLGVLYFNTGLYASTYIPDYQIPFVSSGLLGAFILTGGYVTLIGRVCSLYTFQWSFSVALTWNARLMTAGMILPTIAAIIVLAVWHSVPAVLFALYVMLLSLNLLVIGSLYAMHMHSIWLSPEGHAIMLGIFAHIALVAILIIGLDFRRYPSAVAFIHVGGIALATIIMIPCAFWLAHRRCSFGSRIKLPTEAEVVAWYCTRKEISAPPLGATEEQLMTWYKQRFAAVAKKDEEKKDDKKKDEKKKDKKEKKEKKEKKDKKDKKGSDIKDEKKKEEGADVPKDPAAIDLEPIEAGLQKPASATDNLLPVVDDKLEKKRKLAEAIEAKKAAQSIVVAAWEKYERMCRKFVGSFTLKLRRLLPFDISLSLWHDSFVADRVCRSYEAEETLMRWYCLSMDKDRPRFASKEWNFNIVQAQSAMKMKTMTVDSHRGGLMWAWLRPWLIYGFLYYIMLFLADLVAIFSGGFKLSSFMPSKSIYALAKACSLIVLLLGCALLEPAIVRAARFRDERGPVLDKDSDVKSLARAARRRYIVRYLKELGLMIVGLTIVVAIGAAIFYTSVHLKLKQDITRSLLLIFIALTGAAVGFVLANLNVLFLPNRMFWVLVCGIVSTAIGFGVGIGVYRAFGSDWSVIAVVSATTLWYLSTLVLVIVESSGGAKHDMEHLFTPLQTTAMQTSGQHWVAKPDLPASAQPKFAKILLDHAKTTSPMPRRSPIAAKVMQIFSATLLSFHQEEMKEEEKDAEGKPVSLNKKSEDPKAKEKEKEQVQEQRDRRMTLRAAFPQAERLLQDAADEWIASKMEVYIVPEAMLKLSDDYVFAAVALKTEKSVKVFVASDKIDAKEQEKNYALPRQVAEAILHEYCEQVLGMRHRDACLAELLLLEEGDLVPARIAVQLAAIEDESLIRLENSAFRLWIEEVGYDISHAEAWEELPSETRVALINHSQRLPSDLATFIWTSTSGVAAPAPAVALLQAVAADGKENDKNIEPIDREASPAASGPLPVNEETAARAQLAMLLAQRVSKASLRLRRMRRQNLLSPRTVQCNAQWAKDTEVFAFASKTLQDMRKWLTVDQAKNAASSASILRQCDTVLRLAFLASVGDPSFASEWHHLVHAPKQDGGVGLPGQIVIAPFIIMHVCVRKLTNFFTRNIFLQLRPEIRRLERKLTGLSRVELFDGSRVSSVQHLGIAPLTFFLDYEGDKRVPKAAYRAKGVVTVRPAAVNALRPYDAVMTYAEGKLICKAELSGGHVTKTCFYVYNHSELIPSLKYVYKGDRAELGSPQEADEKAEFLAKFDISREGREVSAVHVRNVNGKKELMHVEYEYNDKDTLDEYPISATVRNLKEPVPEVVKKIVEGRRKRKDLPNEWTTVKVVFHPGSPHLAHCELTSTGGKLYRSEVSARASGNRYKTFEMFEGGRRRSVDTPLIIAEDPWMLLKTSEHCSSIYLDNPLTPMPTLRSELRFFASAHKKRKYYRPNELNTRECRTLLWREWRQGRVEGIFAKMWDEEILRNEPILSSYWLSRSFGRTASAASYLEKRHYDAVAQIEFDNTHPELRSHLLLHVTDLLIFGEGGAAQEVAFEDAGDVIRSNHFVRSRALEVAGIDSGTWPADGGGVANCRRDLIDRASGLRWHMFSEVGTPMKVILYQAERNVQQLVLTPLWGADLGGPSEHILSRVPFGLLEGRRWITTHESINKYFLPLLRIFVRACCVRAPSAAEVELFTSAFVNMYHYFQAFDWVATWASDLVVSEWQTLWLQHAQELMRTEGATLEAECPAPEDVDMLRELIVHLLMPLSVPLPQLPVYHCSHHGLQALQAVIAKQLFGSGVIVWDHGILWRERVKALSEARSFPLFVRNGLVGLSRIGVRIIYHNADMVTACTNVSNPVWERKLGGRHNFSAEDQTMLHKMSPIVNGMEVDRFAPHHEQEARRPTAIMLSHVYDLKDIKNAIRAAVIIVKRFRVSEYQLLIYGATDKDPDYVEECKDLIASNGLSENVVLCGLGDAVRVLSQGWIFVNSSKSEGLPLALGEAGLAGLPVVCTDVGGTKEVISEYGIAHGRLVPAQSAMALARAQLEVLCMLGNLELFVDETIPAPTSLALDSRKGLQLEDFAPLRPDGPSLMARMDQVKLKRRALGMRYRAFVKANFTMDAYLQKHTQQIFLACMRAHERIAQLVQLPESDGELAPLAMRVRHMLLDEEAYNILSRTSAVGSLFPGYKPPQRAKWMSRVPLLREKLLEKKASDKKANQMKMLRKRSSASVMPRRSSSAAVLSNRSASFILGTSQPSLYSPSVADIVEATRQRRQPLVQPGASIVPQKYRIVPAESLVMLYADLRDRAHKIAMSSNDVALKQRVNQMPATFMRPTYSESDMQPEEELALRKREEEMELRGRAIIAQHIDQLEQLARLQLDGDKIEKLIEGVSLLEKLDLLDEMHAELGEIDLGEGFNYGAGGGGVITKYIYINVGGSGENGERTTDDIKREIEENTKILFDENSKEADITAANVNLERLYGEYEKSPEARAETARKKEERRVRHEEENKAALSRLRSRWNPSRVETDQTLRTRIQKHPILKVVLLDPEAILKIHRADFQRYTFDNVELEELRAVRAALPPFPAGMKTQQDWADALDGRIDEMAGPKKTDGPAPVAAEKREGGDSSPAPAAPAAGGSEAAGEVERKPMPPPPPPGGKGAPPPPPKGKPFKPKAAAAQLDANALQSELAAFVGGRKLKKAAKPAAAKKPAAEKKTEAPAAAATSEAEGPKKEKERKEL